VVVVLTAVLVEMPVTLAGTAPAVGAVVMAPLALETVVTAHQDC